MDEKKTKSTDEAIFAQNLFTLRDPTLTHPC